MTVEDIMVLIRKFGAELQAEGRADARGSGLYRRRHAEEAVKLLGEIELAIYAQRALIAEESPARAGH